VNWGKIDINSLVIFVAPISRRNAVISSLSNSLNRAEAISLATTGPGE
jgi:hypothetical protein